MMTAGGWIDPRDHGLQSRITLGHTFRYLLALGFVELLDHKTATVLDAACGSGYGSRILAKSAAHVTALDVDERAIARAKKCYGHPDIHYNLCDLDKATALPTVDVAVSFETVEHLEGDPARFVGLLQECARYFIILSAPVIPTVHVNKHHRHDFTEKDILAMMLTKQWVCWEKVRQGPYLVVAVYKNGDRCGEVLG